MRHIKRLVKSLKKLHKYLPSLREILIFSGAVLLTLVVMRLTSPVPLGAKPLAAGRDARVSIAWLPSTVSRWNDLSVEMGERYDIDPELIAILMTMESAGDSSARSEAGAVGLMQVTPTTAQDIARLYLKTPRQDYDLTDPRTNVEFAAAYLDMLRDEFAEVRYGPDWNVAVELIAAGYNGGAGTAGALYRGEGLRDTEPVVYSRDAYNMWRERRQAKSPTYERWLERGGNSLLERAERARL